MKTIICTTGTSIASGIKPDQISSQAIKDRLKRLRADVKTPEEYLIRASAESHSLYRMRLDPGDAVHLLHSETEDGKVCAQELETLVSNSEELGQTVRLHEIPGLQVENRDRFRREGIDNLFSKLEVISRPSLDRGQGSNVYLNVTGGFKSVVPYVTLFGLLYRLPIVYIFERSQTLITLPPAAINFDFERLAQVDDALHRLNLEGVMPKDEFFEAIPNLDYPKRDWVSTLVEEEDGHVTLSAFGMLVSRAVDREFPSVHLSPNARAAYDRASGDVLRRFTAMLDRASNPIWRSQHRHPFHGTDLTVFKPGNTSERMAGFVHNEEVYVCELYQHDQYERELPGRNKADYTLASFELWTRPADQDQALPRTEEEEFRQLQDDLSACHQLLEASEQRLEESRQALENADSEHKSREAKLLERIEHWRGRCGQLEKELERKQRISDLREGT